MAKHKESGCEGQAGLRREEEGSAILMERLFRWNAANSCKPGSGILAHRIPSDIGLEEVLDGLVGIEEVRVQEVPYAGAGDSESGCSDAFEDSKIYDLTSPRKLKRPSKIVAGFLAGILSFGVLVGSYKNSLSNPGEMCKKIIADGYFQSQEEAHELPCGNVLPVKDEEDEFPGWDEEPHIHVERYEFKPPVGPVGGDSDAGKGRDVVIVGEFRSKNLEDYPVISELIGRRIQKKMVEELNMLGMKAMEMDEVLEEKMYTREEVEKDPEMLYRIPGVNAVLEGSYEVGDPEGGAGDSRVDIGIRSKYVFFGSGEKFDFRVYELSGDFSDMKTMCICLTNRVVGEKSPSKTHEMIFVFWLAVSF